MTPDLVIVLQKLDEDRVVSNLSQNHTDQAVGGTGQTLSLVLWWQRFFSGEVRQWRQCELHVLNPSTTD